ncbi:hypothetical protein QBC46DRAFT_314425 [Diplogelasinospora grovesii]|uniref:PX domain-containing protein n=1 Tax=Diplogelasinospora grovesii TaxID=303347 RepID=A0AAN6N8C3_9PEZI|nr:hypothetical protein QBC46DRAFT_314425 [Diplogelasinospora grovesii]
MQIKPDLPEHVSPVPAKPQIHSHKYHHTYNGTRQLPSSIWVRPTPTLNKIHDGEGGEHTLAYEVTLYYQKNRACTIYRTWDDFVQLSEGLSAASWGAETTAMPTLSSGFVILDSDFLDAYLRDVLTKRPNEIATEYFLRRRIGDCGW